MSTKIGKYVMCLVPKKKVRVIRFLYPDNYDALYDGDHETSSLSQDIRATALTGLADGETVVFNFAGIERFPSMFFSVLLVANEAVKARNGRIVVCNLGPHHRDGFDLMNAKMQFAVAASEDRAVKRMYW